MLVGKMVRCDVQDHLEATRMRRLDQRAQIRIRAEASAKVEMVGDGIAEVAGRAVRDRR
jgi:hypothetical protein